MNKEIKENLTGLMITLGTDTDFNRIDLIKYKIRSILLFYKIFKILA